MTNTFAPVFISLKAVRSGVHFRATSSYLLYEVTNKRGAPLTLCKVAAGSLAGLLRVTLDVSANITLEHAVAR